MENQQPPPPLLQSQSQAKNEDAAGKKKNSRRLPTPNELVAHYEKQGMDTQEASFKVIQDLQNAVFRMITTTTQSKKKGDSASVITSKKLDVIHSRLLQLESKLDSKPGHSRAVGIGVASAGIWNAAVQIWNSVSQATSSSSDA